ncbi:putative uncharacterized protein [Rhodococcus sp. AW25M09]|nr:putative uncharacterized protein [Rhodococcus sp. AW25M09]
MDPVLLNRAHVRGGSANYAAVAGLHWPTLAVRLRMEAKLWRAGVRRLVNQFRRWSANAEATSGMRMQ